MMRPTLPDIVNRRREGLAERKSVRPLADVRAMAQGLPPTRGFACSLASAHAKPAVIAEIKKASPSGGLLRAEFDLEAIAETYARCGASGLSILTEEAFFQGDMSYLGRVRAVVDTPLLQKDFLFDPYQVYEARLYGADAILLIAAILSDAQLAELAGVADELGLDVLLEVHDEEELERAINVATPMLGINHRNLKTYAIDLATSEKLIQALGSRRGDRLIVGESGIRTRADVEKLRVAGVDAVLIGETLMRRPDLGQAYQELFGVPHAHTH